MNISSPNGAGPHGANGAPTPPNGAHAPLAALESRFAPGAWPAPRPVALTAADESVDVGALARTVAVGWRALLVGALAGALVGLALVAAVRPWYRGSASVLVRNANDPTGSLLSRFGLAGDVAGASAGGALGGVLKSSLETEVQLLQSRELAGIVVDSLALQARVLAPRGVPARLVFGSGPIGTSFRRRTVAFTRQPDGGYRAESGDAVARFAPGRPGRVAGVGEVTLAAGPLPPTFRVRFEDREDAITRVTNATTVEKLGGDVVKLRYDGPDSLTAAAVPNVAIGAYLNLRRTVDRGLNARRYEFMVAQADSAARQLAVAEDALRREQEASGVVDPELAGKSGVEAIQEVRSQYVTLESERQSAHALVAAVERGALSPRELAAFPSFLRSPGINGILEQINTTESQRTQLLGTRTERDPDVVVLTKSISDLERGLLPLARTYAGALDRQTSELRGEQRAIEARLGALPGQAESAFRRQRDVKRLSQVVLGLQAQIIDARLAALSEGGQVRQVDVAVAPKRPLFPRAVWTLPGGAVLGFVGAVVWLLARSAWSSRVRSVEDAERATGLPAAELRPGTSLLLGGVEAGTVVILGAGRGASATRAVAEALAARARAGGRTVSVLDVPAASDAGGRAGGAAAWEVLRRAEDAHDLVYVAAAAVDDPGAAALLDRRRAATVVAAEGETTRSALAAAAATLARLGMPVLGVVVAPRSVASRSGR